MSEMCSLPLLNCHGNFAPRNFGLPDQNFHQTKLSMTEHFVAIMSCLYLEGQLLKGCMFTYKWIDMFFFVCACVYRRVPKESKVWRVHLDHLALKVSLDSRE